MPPPRLTDQQKELVQAACSLFAEACPGSGKTRAIVARFLHRTEEEQRKGIALLSFTNAAINEVRRRCGDRLDVLAAPHFVGTFDSFINRFIVRPLYVQQYGQTPRFIDSWAGIEGTSVRITDMNRMPSLELDWFEFDWMLRATLKSDWIPIREKRTLTRVIASHQTELETRATERCRSQVARGMISCSASRALLSSYLRSAETKQLIGNLLAARFSEVIVDEAQDCGPEELLTLRLLREFDVKIIAVADLDQSIFEFRRAEPDHVRTFAESLDSHLILDGNFRSSPAICKLNTSLRYAKRAERAVGPQESSTTPIQIVAFQETAEIATRVASLATDYGLTQQEIIFLAHRGSDARICAGAAVTTGSATNRVLAVARAGAELRSRTSTARTRLHAVQAVERILLSVVDNSPQNDDVEPIDPRWLRDAAVRLAVSLDPRGNTRTEFAARLRDYVKAMRWPSTTKLRNNLGSLLKAPPEDDWDTAGESPPDTYTAATIHSVKGQEFPSVVVILPKNSLRDDSGDVLDHWQHGLSSELRRVLYVGVSRAQQLLVLAIHNDHMERLANILEYEGVPYTNNASL